jgi:hypothetical protein
MTMEQVAPSAIVPERPIDDPEAMRVATFSETLERIEHTQVIETTLEMETREPVADAVRYFSTMEREVGTRFYVNPAHAQLTDVGAAKFEPRQSRLGTASGHGVFFGDLHFDDGSQLAVAVKPHEEGVTSCATDYFTNEAAKAMEYEALDAVGVIVGPDGKAYSMSVLMDDLTTADSIDWRTVARREDQAELMSTWDQIARYIAMVHSNGSVSHRDLALRNIAIAPDGSGVFLIDWELAKVSKLPPRDPEARYENSRPDLGELMESMTRRPGKEGKAGIGLLIDSPNPWNDFCQLVFNEYVSVRLDSASAKELPDVNDELVELERSLKSHMNLVLHQEGRDV